MYMFVGHDPNGVPRVYGHDLTEAGALVQARDAAKEYLRVRPDTGPLARWTFERANDPDAPNSGGISGWDIEYD
jgi:hypothetical protein